MNKTKKSEATKTVKVSGFKGKADLTEIYQKTGLYYAFINKNSKGEYDACHPWVKCRDFLHDVVRTNITGKGFCIYGLRYSMDKNPPIDLNKMRIIVKCEDKAGKSPTDDKFAEDMKYALTLLNHFEKYAGVSLSTLKYVKVDNHEGSVAMFTGSYIWVRSPFLVSMYTLLIRLGPRRIEFKDKADLEKKFYAISRQTQVQGDNEVQYMKTLHNKLHIVIENRNQLFNKSGMFHDIYDKKHDISSFHNNCGILSLVKGITPDTRLNTEVIKTIGGSR